ncbi:MAG: cyclic nucleotide-binding domain-containing protein [Pyrinomonadaceae bacterium]
MRSHTEEYQVQFPSEQICSSLDASIASGDFFRGWDEDLCSELKLIEIRRSMRAKTIVIESGLHPGNIYICISGQTSLSIGPDLVYPEPGRIFGMIESLSGTKFKPTLRTVSPCDFNVIDKDTFIKFLESHPAASWQTLNSANRTYQRLLENLRDH